MNSYTRGKTSTIKSHCGHYIFFPAAIFYMELVLKLYCFDTFWDAGLFYTALFSIVFGVVLAVLCGLWRRGVNRVLAVVLLSAVTLYFLIQTVYFTIFHTFTTLSSVAGAQAAMTHFSAELISGIYHALLPILFLLVPLILYIILRKRLTPAERPRTRRILLLLVFAVAVQVTNTLVIANARSGVMPDRYVYSEIFSPVLSVPRFGALTTLRLDIQDMVKAALQKTKPASGPDTGDGPGAAGNTASPEIIVSVDLDPSEPSFPSPSLPASSGAATAPPSPVPQGDNVLPVDFDALISGGADEELNDMHRYFQSVTPTARNEYTGMFEGYNLVWIVAEGFSSLALDEAHTPTLTRLAREGFVFNNFYNPVWGVSTSDGEYVASTGLIPKGGVWSYYRSAENAMPFGFGNMFTPLGYSSRAYHNNTYTYYNRHESYPNMGYDYKAVGNGLEMTKQWPQSDLEMIEKTAPDYIDDECFLVYYMTISGHMNYTFTGNMMAYNHRDEVADLPYSEPARAYIACNMEFDLAVEELIARLERAGKLEDTVIVISGDHYPYGLTQEEMEELAGGGIEKNFELYRSTLMIWNSEMETVEVNKPCSSLDIMPTLANLFGLSYDSRLVMGQDILSDAPPLVIFNNHSFITQYGRYDASRDRFTADDGAQPEEGYVSQTMQAVNDKFKYSQKILERDYYGVLFERLPDGRFALRE